MANYDELMGLVEEVKDLLASIEEDKAVMGKFKKGTAHNPFKWVKKGKSIGPAVGGRTNKKKGYWNCRCAGYRCLCKGSEGEHKKVIIGRAYKAKYNTLYRRWRAKHAAKYQPGKVFMARPKASKKAKGK